MESCWMERLFRSQSREEFSYETDGERQLFCVVQRGKSLSKRIVGVGRICSSLRHTVQGARERAHRGSGGLISLFRPFTKYCDRHDHDDDPFFAFPPHPSLVELEAELDFRFPGLFGPPKIGWPNLSFYLSSVSTITLLVLLGT